MKTWKRNALVAAVLLVVCAGIYLNWLYTDVATDLTDTLDADKILGEATLVFGSDDNAAQPDDDAADTVAEYFARLRLTRQNARQSAINTLQETISYAEGADITTAKQQLEQLVADALTESQIESLVLAKGYDDCVAYIGTDGIDLAVAAPQGGLSKEDVALLADIIVSQTDYEMADIRVVGV